jgi:hypothetical protein
MKVPPGPFTFLKVDAMDAKKGTKKSIAKRKDESPVFLVRPAIKNFGMDYLHIALIALVVILAVLAFSLSGFRHQTQTLSTSNCTNGAYVFNKSCVSANHTSAEALNAGEKVLASYSSLNSSLSLLPYFSLVNSANVSFLPTTKEWLVVVPVINPFTNQTIKVSMLLYDSNLSLAAPFQQMSNPEIYTNSSVVASGVVSLSGTTPCVTSGNFPVDYFIDPYGPGELQDMQSAINTSRADKGAAVSFDFLFTAYSEKLYGTYGSSGTQLLGKYLLCGSAQSEFPSFYQNVSAQFHGTPLSNYTLQELASASDLNYSEFNSCLLNSTSVLQAQLQLSKIYNITSTPEVVLNCKYLTIPETLGKALNYTEGTISK